MTQTLKFKPVALPCGDSGANRLYTTNLFRGGCPHACVFCYASALKGFSRGGPRPVAMEAIKNVKKWPRWLFLSSASDPFHPIVADLAEEAFRASLPTGTFVATSTKALATPAIVDILSQYADQVSYTVSLSTLSEERNRLLEPNAPCAQERLHGKRENNSLVLCGIEQLARRGIYVTLKADTLFPGLDDTDQNLTRLLTEAKACGAKAANFSYAFYRQKFKAKLTSIPLLQESLALMSERQPIASGTGFSLPLSEKRVRLARMAELANSIGFDIISTCACKNRVGALPEKTPMHLDCNFHERWF